MSDSGSVGPHFPEGDEAFTTLVLRYLDGLATAEEVAWLNDALRAGPGCRALFVHTCQLHSEMREVFAPIRLAVAEGQGRRGRRKAPAAGRRAAAGSEVVSVRAAHTPPDDRGPLPADPATEPQPEAAKDVCEDTHRIKLSAEDTVFPEGQGGGAEQPPPA